MNAAGELHIQSLFDGFEKVHDQMMRHVESAQCQHVLVIRPLAFDERDVQAFFLEKALFDGSENRRLAGQADIPHANFGRAAAGVLRALFAARQEECAQCHRGDEIGDRRISCLLHDG